MSESGADRPASDEQAFRDEIARLNKIVTALMNRAERSASNQRSDFGMFQTTLMLESQVRERTEALEESLHENEKINRALHNAKAQMEIEMEERKRTLVALEHEQKEQRILIKKLEDAHHQLLQSEKMASIGQLAAGVAHEINNPIGYVHSNLGSLQEYLHSLFSLIEVYERALRLPDPKAMLPEIEEMRARYDIDFITGDLPQLMSESREGIERVTAIVRNLKDFSYSGRDDSWKSADLHAGLDSTINIVWNELKYKVTLERHYGKLPLVQCRPSELNQVFMNILLNASHAIDERGTITVSTGVEGDEVWVEIQDSGHGIPEEILQRIFDPFFTTKPVGSGTGLGLSISYGIVKKHNGRIEARNIPGAGACFRIMLPIRQPSADAA